MVEKRNSQNTSSGKAHEGKKQTELKSKGSNCGIGWVFTACKTNMI